MLARQVGADIVLLDERRGREAAVGLGLSVTGALGVLDAAAGRGLIDLPAVLARLRTTSFRASPRLLRELLARHAARS
jgi:predicted nucleic acid-binding protein